MVGLNANTATYLALLGLSSFLPHVLSSLDPSIILPIPPVDSPVSPLAPPSAVDLVLDLTSDLPLATPLAPPLAVDSVLDQTSDLPLTASPAPPPTDSSVSPQELVPPVDLVID
uniref:Uncharacterized protein n=1 Tax=Fagus sylvatica TaxID=28930 RepID=A0A2N9GJR7_FAGSY